MSNELIPPPFKGVTVNSSPLHICSDIASISGLGFTVTVISNGIPTHEPAALEVGVTE